MKWSKKIQIIEVSILGLMAFSSAICHDAMASEWDEVQQHLREAPLVYECDVKITREFKIGGKEGDNKTIRSEESGRKLVLFIKRYTNLIDISEGDILIKGCADNGYQGINCERRVETGRGSHKIAFLLGRYDGAVHRWDFTRHDPPDRRFVDGEDRDIYETTIVHFGYCKPRSARTIF